MKWGERLGIAVGRNGSISCPVAITELSLRVLQPKSSPYFPKIMLHNIIFYCSSNHRIVFFFDGLFMEVYTEIMANLSTNTSCNTVLGIVVDF